MQSESARELLGELRAGLGVGPEDLQDGFFIFVGRDRPAEEFFGNGADRGFAAEQGQLVHFACHVCHPYTSGSRF